MADVAVAALGVPGDEFGGVFRSIKGNFAGCIGDGELLGVNEQECADACALLIWFDRKLAKEGDAGLFVPPAFVICAGWIVDNGADEFSVKVCEVARAFGQSLERGAIILV